MYAKCKKVNDVVYKILPMPFKFEFVMAELIVEGKR